MSIPYQPTQPVLQTGNGQNFLTWPIVVGATSYTIQRSTDGVNFTNLGTSPTANYLDPTPAVGTNYFYQVASTNVSGSSAYTPSYPPSIVPCLPGQINLGYIRYMSQLRADKLNSEYLTMDEWNFNINQSVNALYDMLVSKWGDNYFFAPPLLITLTGADQYPLPTGGNYQNPDLSFPPAMYKLSGVDQNVNGNPGQPNGWYPVARFNWSDRDKYNFPFGVAPGFFNGFVPLCYREMGNNLYIIPNNTNQVIRIWYVPIMQQLLQDTDMMSFSISGWSEWVINDAAMKAMIKEESLEKWQALAGANGQIENRIDTMANNRDVEQVNTVQNLRATSSDPNFGGFGFGNGYGGQGFGF